MNQHVRNDGGGDAKAVEVHARTVDEAVARGLVRLGGLSRSEVEIEIVSEGRSGLLGFGSEEAVVRLRVLAPGEEPRTVEPARKAEAPTKVSTAAPAKGAEDEVVEGAPAEQRRDATPRRGGDASKADRRRSGGSDPVAGAPPAATDDAAQVARETTVLYLRLLGYEDATVEEGEALVPMDVEEEASLVLNVRGADAQNLLARDGRPLLSLQFLIRLAVNRKTGTLVNLLLDVDGDRARRVKELFALAKQSAELVDRDGRPVSLPPMTPYERRVVHLALKEHPSVITQSIGVGESRKVTVRLKGHELPEV